MTTFALLASRKRAKQKVDATHLLLWHGCVTHNHNTKSLSSFKVVAIELLYRLANELE